MQRPLVKILVVVALIQVRTLMTEVGKVFTRSVFLRELAGPKQQLNCVKTRDWSVVLRKGNGVNIPML